MDEYGAATRDASTMTPMAVQPDLMAHGKGICLPSHLADASIVMDTRDRTKPEITALLRQLSAGSSEALHAIIPLVYRELRSIAHRHLRREDSGHTLNTTALVHEAYLRLVDVRRVEWQDRTHFFAMASRMMRRVLINYARRERRVKRGGGTAPIPLEDRDLPIDDNLENLLALDEALTRLEAAHERRCRVVECRFFAGLDVQETAEALGVSPETVKRDWRLARLWLNRQLAAARRELDAEDGP